ncbi:hypothetical protein ASB62_03410 [Chlorobium limicola]|uniref:NYN domain-containing protein n=2 Tax=Chlorobium limicola TaxID=1092 RepID=A0A101JQK7_CHLLI|nr:hypothetical protein ASB62_03410 [Chlorobium limicola]
MRGVNRAAQMLVGACQDQYDMAMLISGDSDPVPPIREIHSLFSVKKVFVAFPPKRHSKSMAAVAIQALMR